MSVPQELLDRVIPTLTRAERLVIVHLESPEMLTAKQNEEGKAAWEEGAVRKSLTEKGCVVDFRRPDFGWCWGILRLQATTTTETVPHSDGYKEIPITTWRCEVPGCDTTASGHGPESAIYGLGWATHQGVRCPVHNPRAGYEGHDHRANYAELKKAFSEYVTGRYSDRRDDPLTTKEEKLMSSFASYLSGHSGYIAMKADRVFAFGPDGGDALFTAISRLEENLMVSRELLTTMKETAPTTGPWTMWDHLTDDELGEIVTYIRTNEHRGHELASDLAKGRHRGCGQERIDRAAMDPTREDKK